ncbi:MAG: LysM peptidoglycan-binding domain-containing protein [Patescibacteria group bacterium]|jgi:hypothetical protein
MLKCHFLRNRQITINGAYLVLFSLLFVFPVIQAKAVEYGGIGGRPAYPRTDNPRTESIFIHTLKPGDIQKEGVLLVNNAAEKKTLLVYGVDSVVSSGGAFACRQMSEPKGSVGSWIKLEKNEVVLNPGANDLVPFTIEVPQTAGVGEHNGCIVIQEKKEDSSGQAGVNLSFRTGLRVAISIPGEIVRKLEITEFRITKEDNGNILLSPTIKNSGNVSVDTNIDVTTKNIFGGAYLKQGGEFPILRDQSSDWNFEIKKPFWGGFYRSSLRVEYQEDLSIEIGKNSNQPKTVLTGETITFFSFPKPLALMVELLFLIVGVIMTFLWRVYNKRKQWIKKSWKETEIKSGEDIKSLADRLEVSWRLLAKVNKLQAPYTLKPGQKLKVPPRP